MHHVPPQTPEVEEQEEVVDIVIVGAGLSGIDAAYRAQTLNPDARYLVVEARDGLGGTWDLFKYPGLRSDSDMYTLGFPFEPWTHERSIALGPDIREYIDATAKKYDIERHVRYGHRVRRCSWSSEDALWSLDVETAAGKRVIKASFVFMAAGYYSYDRPNRPEFPGEATYTGEIVHPQFWPEDLEARGKRFAVIGSGATAMTLVPSLAAQGASRTTMVQRTPTYVISLPGSDPVARIMQRVLGARAYRFTRERNVIQTLGFYHLSRRFPRLFARLLKAGPRLALRGWAGYDAKHFTPPYKPWDQRLCVVPDADLFKAVRSGAADIVTGPIEAFEPTGIRMADGSMVEADVIVTATGLSMQLSGGVEFLVDGHEAGMPSRYLYRGCLVEGMPNFGVAIGYTNASWTLRADMSASFFFRFVAHVRAHGYAFGFPQPSSRMATVPAMDLTAGYVTRAIQEFPKGGDREPWMMRHDYFRDRRELRRADVTTEMIYVAPGGQARPGPGSAQAEAASPSSAGRIAQV